MPFVTNIQKYCIHDGKGIRTTVFFKGCPLNCRWCHNPETQKFSREIRFFADRCTGCGKCVKACQRKALALSGEGLTFDRTKCVSCGRCVQVCASGAMEAIGRQYDVKTLVKLLAKDQMFYEESGGGVTLSGGEVMALPESYLLELVRRLDEEGISVNIDTCGFCSWDSLEKVLPYVDTFLYDLKLLDAAEHLQYTGVSNETILENLERLSDAEARIWIRIPVIQTVNGDISSITAVGHWLREHHIQTRQINLIKYHDFGADKYEQLGMSYGGKAFTAPDDETMQDLKQVLDDMGFVVHIGG